MDINEKRDAIYLQGVPYPDETTWCEDKIHESDTKYLLATPKREAASALYEALRNLLQISSHGYLGRTQGTSWSEPQLEDAHHEAEDALELATEEGDDLAAITDHVINPPSDYPEEM